MQKLLLITILQSAVYSTTAQNLHLYGGDDYTVYLGCLDCSRFESKSIWNAFGDYGSSFSNTSIWNDLNNYGDTNNPLSPWNTVSNKALKIVDDSGKFQGYLSANLSLKDRSNSRLANELVKNHEEITKNLSKWYKKLIVDYSKL